MVSNISVCSTCNREFIASSRHKKCPKCRAIDKKKPCAKCQALVWGNSTVCIRCHNGSGSDSPSWKGGKIFHKKGTSCVK